MRSPISIVDVDRTDTWTRYKTGMCNTCAANCCAMPVEVRMDDLIRLNLVDPFEALSYLGSSDQDPLKITEVKLGGLFL